VRRWVAARVDHVQSSWPGWSMGPTTRPIR